jgi:hypothetical protein
MRCLDCGKTQRIKKNVECWTYQKCGKCFHHGHKEYPKMHNMRELRANNWPTDLYMDKGMEHEIRELEKNEN